MRKRLAEDDFIKPFWRTWWFWLLVALIIMRLPLFGNEQADIPEDLDETFYYEARDSYVELFDGWIDRKVPEGLTPEWVTFHYNELESGQIEFTEKEKEIVVSLNTMLTELVSLEEAWNKGEGYDHHQFVEAAQTARNALGLADENEE